MHNYSEKIKDEAKEISVDDAAYRIYIMSAWCEVHGLPSIANTLRAACEKIEDKDEMEMLAHAKRPYKVSEHEAFAKECEAGGFTVVHYMGRGGYSGPAVMSDDDYSTQDIIRATSVRVAMDSMGHGSVVYPGGC